MLLLSYPHLVCSKRFDTMPMHGVFLTASLSYQRLLPLSYCLKNAVYCFYLSDWMRLVCLFHLPVHVPLDVLFSLYLGVLTVANIQYLRRVCLCILFYTLNVNTSRYCDRLSTKMFKWPITNYNAIYGMLNMLTKLHRIYDVHGICSLFCLQPILANMELCYKSPTNYFHPG